MTSSQPTSDQGARDDLRPSFLTLNRLETQPVNQNYSEALQELLMQGTTHIDYAETLSAPPEFNPNSGFLSPLRAVDPGHLSPYTHLSESGYENFSDYTTPGFGDDLSDIALSSIISLQGNPVENSVEDPFEVDVTSSNGTSKDRNSSVGDSVTHPSTRLLSPILTNTPGSLSRRSTGDLSADYTYHINSTNLQHMGSQNPYRPSNALGINNPNLATSSVYYCRSPELSSLNRPSIQHEPVLGPPYTPSLVVNSKPSSSRRGINPNDRDKLNETSIPSLEDQTKERELAKTKAGVEEWLTTTDANEPSGSNNIQSREVSEDASAHGRDDSLTSTAAPTPGPGLYVLQPEEDDDFSSEDGQDDDATSLPDGGDSTPPASYIQNSLRESPSNISAEQNQTFNQKPWADFPFDVDSASIRGQPFTSNAAMARFERRAKDIETASQTATIASSFRRRSLESLFSAANISVVPPSEADSSHISERGREKRPGFLNRILPKRSSSNLKRKETREGEEESTLETLTKRDSQGSTTPMRRVSSWARPKSPSFSTSSNTIRRSSTAQSANATLSPTSGPWLTNVIKRARSRSDLSQSSALADKWASQGGPPVANLRPSQDTAEQPSSLTKPTPDKAIERHDSDLDVERDGEQTPTGLVDVPMSVLAVPAAPTPEAFKSHAANANPHMETYMLERVTSEQLKRYRRLVEARLKHSNQVTKHNCPSHDFCSALGGGPKFLPPRKTGPDSEGPAVAFFISRTGPDGEVTNPPPDDDSIPASFPEGIPSPPASVHRLPAEFECPLCFQVKRILKPSDWTKHVHEDLQPFTCSFPDCGEPKSFKRKADWVRHENERHRQLEKWICNFPDCHHTCYRKDNFVQHLVREHKLPEPRLRSSKAMGGNSYNHGNDQNQVAMLIETCRHDTTRRPDEEACRFCGNYLTTWKKLSAHLAKHMEQISLPVLTLAHQVELGQSANLIGPVEQEQGPSRRPSAGTISNPISSDLPRQQTNYAISPNSSLQQPFINYPTAGISEFYPTGSYATQNPTPENRMARPESVSFPGTKNLSRRTSPYREQVAGDARVLSHTKPFLETEQTPLFNSVQNEFQDTAFGHGHGAPSTYPPPFMPVTSQPQASQPVKQSSLYPNDAIYTSSPTYEATFSPDDFSPPSNSVRSIYLYTQGTVHSSPAEHSERSTPYVPRGSHPEIGANYNQYPGNGSALYSATGPNTYSHLQPETYNNNRLLAESRSRNQNTYFGNSPSQIQEYYLSVNPGDSGMRQGGQSQNQMANDFEQGGQQPLLSSQQGQKRKPALGQQQQQQQDYSGYY